MDVVQAAEAADSLQSPTSSQRRARRVARAAARGRTTDAAPGAQVASPAMNVKAAHNARLRAGWARKDQELSLNLYIQAQLPSAFDSSRCPKFREYHEKLLNNIKESVKHRTVKVADIDKVETQWHRDQERVQPWRVICRTEVISHDTKPTDGYDDYWIVEYEDLVLYVGRMGTHFSTVCVVYAASRRHVDEAICNVLGFNDCLGVVLYSLCKVIHKITFITNQLMPQLDGDLIQQGALLHDMDSAREFLASVFNNPSLWRSAIDRTADVYLPTMYRTYAKSAVAQAPDSALLTPPSTSQDSHQEAAPRLKPAVDTARLAQLVQNHKTARQVQTHGQRTKGSAAAGRSVRTNANVRADEAAPAAIPSDARDHDASAEAEAEAE